MAFKPAKKKFNGGDFRKVKIPKEFKPHVLID